MITGSWVRDRGFAMPRLLPRRIRSLHSLVLVLALVLVGYLGWLWYRDSSFVKVHRVTVTGLSGPDVPEIRDALTQAALGMTTLDMQISKLESVVQQYAYVQSITVTTHGAHAVTIHVAEQVPVAVVKLGGNLQVVDADGRLLSSTTVTHSLLPLVPLRSAPASGRIEASGARAAVAVLAAAPYSLLPHIASATSTGVHGAVVQLRNGPQLYFGEVSQLHQKWDAALAVLRDRHSAGADYIDVTDPLLPAAGVGVSPRQASALGLTTSSSTSSTGSTSSTSSTSSSTTSSSATSSSGGSTTGSATGSGGSATGSGGSATGSGG
jgi:cell division septal protein FtsQ